MREFVVALPKVTNHKVPGSDEIRIKKQNKYLNEENNQILLLMLNDWWFLERIPSIFLNA